MVEGVKLVSVMKTLTFLSNGKDVKSTLASIIAHFLFIRTSGLKLNVLKYFEDFSFKCF